MGICAMRPKASSILSNPTVQAMRRYPSPASPKAEPGSIDVYKRQGCDLVQGYVYARPMPAEELEAWMRARHGGEVTQI